MKRKVQAFGLGILLVCGLAIFQGCESKSKVGNGNDPSGEPVVGTQVGNIIQEVEGKSLSGKDLKLSGFRGRIVMLDFWAGW